MKKITFFILFFFSLNFAYAQVEGVEVEKPKEEKKIKGEEKSKKNEDEDGEKLSFMERLYFGGNLSLNFGTITFIDISPMVGYRITPKFSAGVGATYIYWRDSRFVPDFVQNVYGGRLFSRYDVANDFLGTGNLFAHAEYEQLYAKDNYINQQTGLREERVEPFPSLFIGGGLAMPLGNRSAFTITFLYDVIYDDNQTIYGRPFQVRIGGFF